MNREQTYTFFEIRPGMDVYDADGQNVGSVKSIWEVGESGERHEIGFVEGIGPRVEHTGAVAAPPPLPRRGYLIVERGLLGRDELVVPFDLVARVTDAYLVLSCPRSALQDRRSAG